MINPIEQKTSLTLPEILGVPKRGIIFSDLDGVWFDEEKDFAPPEPQDLAILQEAREAGFWLVLNSDTAADTLALFAQDLGFDPPVIAEKGAIVYLPNQRIKEYLSPFKPFFDQYKQEVVIELIEKCPQAAIFVGDATSLIQAKATIPGSNNLAFLVNSARECSLGVYTRILGENGQLLVDDEQTRQTEKLLNTLLDDKPEGDLLVCKRYSHLGSCLVKDPNQQKWRAVEWFIDQFPTGLAYYMMGDSTADSMAPIKEKIVTCAVGNASTELKETARRSGGILAPEDAEISQGANYIIKQILTL